jgi:hypothetical protein
MTTIGAKAASTMVSWKRRNNEEIFFVGDIYRHINAKVIPIRLFLPSVLLYIQVFNSLTPMGADMRPTF